MVQVEDRCQELPYHAQEGRKLGCVLRGRHDETCAAEPAMLGGRSMRCGGSRGVDVQLARGNSSTGGRDARIPYRVLAGRGGGSARDRSERSARSIQRAHNDALEGRLLSAHHEDWDVCTLFASWRIGCSREARPHPRPRHFN